jgi:poly-beta-hydroxybutyrate-responsive repressor
VEPRPPAGEGRPDGGQPKNFLRPCLLLLLKEEPAHGYDLLEKLTGFGFARDPGGLYRTLRALEHEGLVSSRWEAAVHGRERRAYQLTRQGEEWLHSWAAALQESRGVIDRYLDRYRLAVRRLARPAVTSRR